MGIRVAPFPKAKARKDCPGGTVLAAKTASQSGTDLAAGHSSQLRALRNPRRRPRDEQPTQRPGPSPFAAKTKVSQPPPSNPTTRAKHQAVAAARALRGCFRPHLAGETEAFQRAVAGLVAIGVAVLLVGLVAGMIIARQIARPLGRFEAAASAVAEGDLEARAPVEGSSEQRELARAFNEMTDRLSNSLQTQSRFVADASHQLRTPLAGLRLRLEEARAKSDDDAVIAEVDHGIDELDRLSRTVDELLVLSQTGERDAHAESIEIADLVTSAADRWQPIAGADERSVETDVRTDTAVVASRADMDRVLDALIENAISYSPVGSPIELAVTDHSIVVRDHGDGLAAGEESAVFERFHRGAAGAARSEGTGLGLSIAKELAQRWGADVRLANAEDGGTAATVEFTTNAATKEN